MELTGRVEKGQTYYVAFCDQLPITSHGRTLHQAIAGQRDAAVSYLMALSGVTCAEQEVAACLRIGEYVS